MQPRPTAIELLAVVGEVLEQQLVPALSGPAQHHARVAASLVGIVERELQLGPAADLAERREFSALLSGMGVSVEADVSLADIRKALAEALRSGRSNSSHDVWPVLMAGVRRDLAIVKPGHDEWEGE